MKKVLAIAVLGVFVLGSCKKDRTCECTNADGSKTPTEFAKSKKKDAEEACDALGSINTAFGGKGCELK